MSVTFKGYRRPDGTVGIRNHVAVLSAMDNVNPVVRSICQLVRGTIPVTTLFGRGQFGADNEQTLRTLIGLGRNPNLAAVLVISLEPVSAARLADGIKVTGKPVLAISVQEAGGTINAVSEGARIAADLVIAASAIEREDVDLAELVLAVECGGSDTTSGIGANPAAGFVADRVVDAGGAVLLSETSEFMGAEHILARRAVNEEVGRQIIAAVKSIEDDARQRGVDIRGANPVPDNIKGGLTTIEEKSLGAIAKGGSRQIQGVLRYAERIPGKGLYIMDTPAPAVESLTGLAAGGALLAIFTTGVGNTIGHPVLTTLKITANPNTARVFGANVDFDLSDVITGLASLEEVGNRLLAEVIKVSSGKRTKAEVLGQEENGIARIEPTV